MNGPNGKPRLGVSSLVAAMMSTIDTGAKNARPNQKPNSIKPPEDVQIRLEYAPGGVRMSFSFPVPWLGFSPDAADELARNLTELAALAREAASKPDLLVPSKTILCEHGKAMNDYCEPCGRIHGGG